jgi:alpha-L-fucosidase
MARPLFGIVCVLALAAALAAGPARPETEAEQKARMKWWTDARFGLFIHWGLYALPARHEWVKSNERLTDEAYARYFSRFDPDLYDPREWARAARRAGMKYFVITTKHHDGFCLWDSKLTDYKATRTPYGKDLIKPLVEAMRAEGLRVGFYHSLLDWHHPDYTVDMYHPMRDDKAFVEKAAGRDMAKYDDYLFGQLKELLTDYGRIDTLFLDFSFPGPSFSRRSSSTTGSTCSMSPAVGIIGRPNSSCPGNGSASTAGPCRGRRARRSPDRGAITATRRPGNRRPS